jgi:hypothetical protein
MKTLNILLTTACFLLITAMNACSPSKIAASDGSTVNIKGAWTVQDVDFEGISKTGFKVTVFNDVSYTCFVGSQWNFEGSGNGTYTIPSTQDCLTGERNIYWSLQNENGVTFFQFKKLRPGDKATKVTDGYQLKVKSMEPTAMVLQDQILFEGKTIYINYHFTR